MFPLLGQLKDDTPPTAPTGLIGVSDPAGVVTLHWSPSPESDVMGYRVFTANSENGDYAQVAWCGSMIPFLYTRLTLTR